MFLGWFCYFCYSNYSHCLGSFPFCPARSQFIPLRSVHNFLESPLFFIDKLGSLKLPTLTDGNRRIIHRLEWNTNIPSDGTIKPNYELKLLWYGGKNGKIAPHKAWIKLMTVSYPAEHIDKEYNKICAQVLAFYCNISATAKLKQGI